MKKTSRYKKCYKIKKHPDDGGQVYLSMYKKLKVDIREDDIIITVNPSDTLDKIAWEYYNDEKLWWVIAEYNDITFPFELQAGKTLIIPSYETLRKYIL